MRNAQLGSCYCAFIRHRLAELLGCCEEGWKASVSSQMAAISSQTVKREVSSPLTSVWWSHGANNPGGFALSAAAKINIRDPDTLTAGTRQPRELRIPFRDTQ
jgi:hypothetical protein